MMPVSAAASAWGWQAGQANPSAEASDAEVGREAVSAGRQPAEVGLEAVSAASQLPDECQQSSPSLQEGTGS